MSRAQNEITGTEITGFTSTASNTGSNASNATNGTNGPGRTGFEGQNILGVTEYGRGQAEQIGGSCSSIHSFSWGILTEVMRKDQRTKTTRDSNTENEKER